MSEEMKGYDVPSVESLSSDEALSTLSKMDADIAGDKVHPYLTATHPQHRKFLETRTRLHEIARPPDLQLSEGGSPLVSQYSEDTAQAMGDAMTGKADKEAKKQTERIKQAKAEADIIKTLGFETTAIPDDVSQRQLDVLVMKRMAAEGDYDNLTPIIGKQLQRLRVSAEVKKQFDLLLFSSEDTPALKMRMAESLIGYINDESRKREGIV